MTQHQRRRRDDQGAVLGYVGRRTRIPSTISGGKWLLLTAPGAASGNANISTRSLPTLLVALGGAGFYAMDQKNAIERMERAAQSAQEMFRTQRQHKAQPIARLGCIEAMAGNGQWCLGEATQEMQGQSPPRTRGSAAESLAKLDDADRTRFLDRLGAGLVSAFSLDVRARERILHARVDTVERRGSGLTTVVTVQDITQRRSSQDERARMVARMAEASRREALRSELGAGVRVLVRPPVAGAPSAKDGPS